MQDADNLIWVDMEMTGLDPDHNVVIEIATIVTDSDLNTLAEGPVIAVHQDDATLAAMDEWNTSHHTHSGLVDRVRASVHDAHSAAQLTLAFLQQWVPAGASPMCGNSICQDRRFMARHMPAAGALLPLPQPGCQHPENPDAALATRTRGGHHQDLHPPGAG